jgi:hypothetical protein
MSPPANIVQVAAGSNGSSSPPLRRVGDAGDAEQLPFAPLQGAHRGCHLLRAQEREAIAVLGEVLGEGRGILDEDDVLRIGRHAVAERGEDALGIGLDQFERLVALARALEDGGHLGPRGARRRAPEVRHRHDGRLDDVRRRVGGSDRRRRRGRSASGGSRGGAWPVGRGGGGQRSAARGGRRIA